jgi:hypothetical protein
MELATFVFIAFHALDGLLGVFLVDKADEGKATRLIRRARLRNVDISDFTKPARHQL